MRAEQFLYLTTAESRAFVQLITSKALQRIHIMRKLIFHPARKSLDICNIHIVY